MTLLKHQSRPSWEWWYGPASCSTRWSSRRGKPERKKVLSNRFDFRIFFYSRCVTLVQKEVWARWTLQPPLPMMGKHHRDCYENALWGDRYRLIKMMICHSIYVDFHHQSHSPLVNIPKKPKTWKSRLPKTWKWEAKGFKCIEMSRASFMEATTLRNIDLVLKSISRFFIKMVGETWSRDSRRCRSRWGWRPCGLWWLPSSAQTGTPGFCIWCDGDDYNDDGDGYTAAIVELIKDSMFLPNRNVWNLRQQAFADIWNVLMLFDRLNVQANYSKVSLVTFDVMQHNRLTYFASQKWISVIGPGLSRSRRSCSDSLDNTSSTCSSQTVKDKYNDKDS